MHGFETLLLIMLGAVGVLALARRIGAPYPALMAIAGAAVAFSPIDIEFGIDPSLALALFVAPILLDAAYDTSPCDLKASWKPLLGLVVVAVGLTVAAVAVTARALVPELSWPAAIALGAIVAPPDAAAAIAVLRQVKPPHAITVILEGESLLNDASALIIYRLAVAAAIGGSSALAADHIATAFLLSVAGSVIVGPVLAFLIHQVTKRIDDAPSSTLMQLVATFGVWVIAERLHLSPILAVVSYGMVTARFAPQRTPARLRVPSYAVWDTAVVVLNALAFVLIGLQVGPVIAAARPGELERWALVAGAVLGIVVAMRLLWVMSRNGFARLRRERNGDGEKVTWQAGLTIGWSGMRGIVTVATALALPANFPERNLMLFTAFAVTLGTLLLQGLTLRPLLIALGLAEQADDPVDREVRAARVALADAALAALPGEDDPDVTALREELELEKRIAADADEGDGRAVLPAKQLRADSLKVRRDRLLALRKSGEIGDDAFHRLEEELDYADLAVATRS